MRHIRVALWVVIQRRGEQWRWAMRDSGGPRNEWVGNRNDCVADAVAHCVDLLADDSGSPPTIDTEGLEDECWIPGTRHPDRPSNCGRRVVRKAGNFS